MFTRSNIFVLVVRIANLLAASFFVLCFIVPDSWCYVAASPPPSAIPNGPMTQRQIIFAGITFIWFVSSLGLFFRSRVAWFGSLVGVGMMIIGFVEFFVSVFRELFFSDARGLDFGRHFIAGLVVEGFVELIFVGVLGICLALSIGLFLGLLKMRKWDEGRMKKEE